MALASTPGGTILPSLLFVQAPPCGHFIHNSGLFFHHVTLWSTPGGTTLLSLLFLHRVALDGLHQVTVQYLAGVMVVSCHNSEVPYKEYVQHTAAVW